MAGNKDFSSFTVALISRGTGITWHGHPARVQGLKGRDTYKFSA
jgi:hypothetical protein